MIGGTDTVFRTHDKNTALDDCVHIIRQYWPEARFEDAVLGVKYSRLADIPFGITQELLVYRDEAAESAWDADRDDSAVNSMLYVLVSDQSVTVVLDDPDTPEMLALLESIRQALLNNCVYDPVGAAA